MLKREDDFATMSNEMCDLTEAFWKLTERQREAFILWREGYTQEEMAEILGITQQSAQERLASAMANIRKCLE